MTIEVDAAAPAEQASRQVVIVDDVLPNALLVKGYLRRLPGTVATTFTDPVAALAWCKDSPPDLLVLDYHMPRMSGLELLREFQAVPALADVPVVIVTAEEGKDALYAALEAGATDFLRKPVDDLELIARTRNMLLLRERHLALAAANERLFALATTDALTGLATRRHFMKRLAEEIARAKRYGRSLSVAMIDLDHFKQVNDRHGHQLGDQVLRTFAECLSSTLRTVDMAGRLGGEEFAICLPETGGASAAIICERILARTRDLRIAVDDGSIGFTASIGITELHEDDDAEDMLLRADTSLYAAKAAGRDRIADDSGATLKAVVRSRSASSA